MMKKLRLIVTAGSIFFLILTLTFPALGGGTRQEAKALVEKAIAYYKANGREKALAEFSNPKGPFVKGHLYIFAYNPEGTIIAHGGDPKLVGQDFIDVKDADGKYFVREFIKIGPKGGWVKYKWKNYVTKKIEDKTTYLKRIDDVIIGCGVYK